MIREPMSTQEGMPSPQPIDELARKRAERAAAGEPQDLRERVRAEARRAARRIAAAQRARRRAASTGLPEPPGGPTSGAA